MHQAKLASTHQLPALGPPLAAKKYPHMSMNLSCISNSKCSQVRENNHFTFAVTDHLKNTRIHSSECHGATSCSIE